MDTRTLNIAVMTLISALFVISNLPLLGGRVRTPRVYPRVVNLRKK